MCEHTRRPKLFCVSDQCPLLQCCACTTCIRSTHNHTLQNFMDQKQIMYLLTRFDPPLAFKEERKATTVKMYKFLTRLKSQMSNKLEEMIVELMSKVKYPYLYNMELLDSYRNIRDKNYLRLNAHKFRFFCKTAKNMSGIDFLEKQKEYYNRYLQESIESLKDFGDKIRIFQKTFGLQLHSDVLQLHEDFLNEVNNFQKTHKVTKSLEKKDYQSMKPKENLNSSVKLEKKNLQFLTPTKPTINLDVSLDNLSYRSSADYKSRRGSAMGYYDTKQNQLDIKENLKRVNTSEEEKQSLLKVVKDETKTVKSNEEKSSKSNNSTSMIAKYTNFDFKDCQDYEKQFENSFKIKVSDVRSDSKSKPDDKAINLTDSLELRLSHLKDSGAKKNSYSDLMNFSIKEREEKIKNRVAEMQKDKIEGSKKSIKNEQNTKKQVEDSLKKTVEKKKQSSGLIVPPSLEKNSSRKQVSLPRKRPDELSVLDLKKQAKPNSNMNNSETRKNPKKSPSKPNEHNISLNKQLTHFQPQKFNLQEIIVSVYQNATKEIPLVQKPKDQSPRKLKLKRKNTIEQIEEQQISASCMFVSKLQELKTVDKKCKFLETFIDKYANCLSAVEYLSFLYLEQSKHKECLALTTQYIQKMDSVNLKDKDKLNLLINNVAALNALGRYSQTVSFLRTKIDYLDNDKIHKCMGDALFNLGMNDRAIYHYEKATKINDKYDEAYYNLAVILYLQESYFNAKMNIDKAIRNNSKNPTYLELLSAINERMVNNSVES